EQGDVVQGSFPLGDPRHDGSGKRGGQGDGDDDHGFARSRSLADALPASRPDGGGASMDRGRDREHQEKRLQGTVQAEREIGGEEQDALEEDGGLGQARGSSTEFAGRQRRGVDEGEEKGDRNGEYKRRAPGSGRGRLRRRGQGNGP